jgi:hypothetical protein
MLTEGRGGWGKGSGEGGEVTVQEQRTCTPWERKREKGSGDEGRDMGGGWGEGGEGKVLRVSRVNELKRTTTEGEEVRHVEVGGSGVR